MAQYHVGCGIIEIYAGTLTPNKKMWKQKSAVTDECVSATAQFLLQNDECFMFEKNGKKYCMKVEQVESEE